MVHTSYPLMYGKKCSLLHYSNNGKSYYTQALLYNLKTQVLGCNILDKLNTTSENPVTGLPTVRFYRLPLLFPGGGFWSWKLWLSTGWGVGSVFRLPDKPPDENKFPQRFAGSWDDCWCPPYHPEIKMITTLMVIPS